MSISHRLDELLTHTLIVFIQPAGFESFENQIPTDTSTLAIILIQRSFSQFFLSNHQIN
jgi:hypothetical protein